MHALARNMAIGAGLASINAFGMLVRGVIGNSNQGPFALQAFATLIAGGALAGAVFTALGPIRRRSSFGGYVAWILTVYVLLAIVVGVGTLEFGDDPTLLKEPAILVFLFGSGAVLGVFCARVARRRSSGDFS